MNATSPSEPAASRAAPSRFARWEAGAWVALWLAARSLLLLAFCDVFVYGEELEKGCAGKALLDGVALPWHSLAYHPYEGGGFVVSHLDALAFALCGQSVLSIKLVALALGAAILLAGWRLCERFGGRGAARAFALLYVFAPESVQANSVLALGIHYQAILFVALVLLLAARIVQERNGSARTWFALGLCAGFGLYFSYQLALTMAVAASAIVFALRRQAFRVGLAWAGAGALLGVAPLLWMAAHVGKEVLDVHGAGLLPSLASLSTKADVLGRFCASLFEGRAWWDAAALLVLALAPFAGWFAARRGGARGAALLLAAHAALFVVSYVASGFTVGAVLHTFYLHRLTPLWFLAIALLALGAGAGCGAWRKVATACVAALALSGAFDTWRMVRGASPRDWGAHFERLAHAKGYRYSQYLQKVAPRLGLARTDALRVLLGFRESDPAFLHEGLAIALYGSGAGSFESMCAELRAAGVTDLGGFYRGLGLALMRQHGDDVAKRIAVVAPFPPEIRDPLVESIGRFGTLASWEFSQLDAVLGEARAGLAAGFPESWFVGLGRRFHDALGDRRIAHYFERRKGPVCLDEEEARAQLAALPDAARLPMLRGYEAARAERSE